MTTSHSEKLCIVELEAEVASLRRQIEGPRNWSVEYYPVSGPPWTESGLTAREADDKSRVILEGPHQFRRVDVTYSAGGGLNPWD